MRGTREWWGLWQARAYVSAQGGLPLKPQPLKLPLKLQPKVTTRNGKTGAARCSELSREAGTQTSR